MQAELSVELGAEDPVLSVPWIDPESRWHYYDLRANPKAIAAIDEAQTHPELKEFLVSLNAEQSAFQTAKCDVWFTEEMTQEDEFFGAKCKMGSYVDVFFRVVAPRPSFPIHEAFGLRLVELLKRAPELPVSFEAIIRRAHFETDNEVAEGLYFTFYNFGYGDDEQTARQSWGIGLRLTVNAILQISSL